MLRWRFTRGADRDSRPVSERFHKWDESASTPRNLALAGG